MFQKFSSELCDSIRCATDRLRRDNGHVLDDGYVLWGLLQEPRNSLGKSLKINGIDSKELAKEVEARRKKKSRLKLQTIMVHSPQLRKVLLKLETLNKTSGLLSTVDLFDVIRRFGSSEMRMLIKAHGITATIAKNIKGALVRDMLSRKPIEREMIRQFRAWKREKVDSTEFGFSSWDDAIKAVNKT